MKRKSTSKFSVVLMAARWQMAKLVIENHTVHFDQVRQRLNAPADFPPPAWGAIAADLHRWGLVRPIGAKQSAFASRHGGIQTHWRLADRKKALHFLARHDESEFREVLTKPEPTLFDDFPPTHGHKDSK